MKTRRERGSDKIEKNSKSDLHARVVHIAQYIPLALVVVLTLAAAYAIFVIGMSVDEILAYTPENYFTATVFILLFYAVKSLSVFFPVVALYVFVGNAYPLWAALLVNLAGLALTLTLPYFVGLFSGRELTEKIVARFDKKGRAKNIGGGNIFFASYMLRIVSFLPADLVSMLLGSTKVSFVPYLLGSLCGSVLSMIGITCMGATVTDPTSPEFIASAAATVVISVASLLIYNRTQKNKKHN